MSDMPVPDMPEVSVVAYADKAKALHTIVAAFAAGTAYEVSDF